MQNHVGSALVRVVVRAAQRALGDGAPLARGAEVAHAHAARQAAQQLHHAQHEEHVRLPRGHMRSYYFPTWKALCDVGRASSRSSCQATMAALARALCNAAHTDALQKARSLECRVRTGKCSIPIALIGLSAAKGSTLNAQCKPDQTLEGMRRKQESAAWHSMRQQVLRAVPGAPEAGVGVKHAEGHARGQARVLPLKAQPQRAQARQHLRPKLSQQLQQPATLPKELAARQVAGQCVFLTWSTYMARCGSVQEQCNACRPNT